MWKATSGFRNCRLVRHPACLSASTWAPPVVAVGCPAKPIRGTAGSAGTARGPQTKRHERSSTELRRTRIPARLDDSLYAELDARLAPADAALSAACPGEPGTRQPAHTVYVPAHRYHAGVAHEWGTAAASLLEVVHLPDAQAVAAVAAIPVDLAVEIRPLVGAKLSSEPIEDLRIDFEDGYGPHNDVDEDAEAERAATELVHSVAAGQAPPYLGIRFKCLEPGTRRRGLRSLDPFLGASLAAGPLPDGAASALCRPVSPTSREAD